MPHIKPDIETFARIKVVGIGGGGGNAVTRMVDAQIKGVDFISVNTDAQDLHHTKAQTKIHIGKNLTRGLGAGMNPDIGRQAAEENREEIQDALKGTDLVFITCGLGGGTGSGASPIIADAARDVGALVVAVVTRPFGFEGAQRAKIADEAIAQLRDRVDTLITIPNDKIHNLIDKNTSILEAFGIVDDILRQGVQGIADLITYPGIVNVDFADIRVIMSEAGSALLGIGKASGEDRAVNAAKSAINSPLLDVSIDGARGVLFNVSGGVDLTMADINEAARVITESIDSNAKVIFGALHDARLKKGEVKVTVIATGFGGGKNNNNGSEPLFKSEAPFKPLVGKPFAARPVISVDVSGNGKKTEIIKNIHVAKKPEIQIIDEEDEWDVPAFLRRKKDLKK